MGVKAIWVTSKRKKTGGNTKLLYKQFDKGNHELHVRYENKELHAVLIT